MTLWYGGDYNPDQWPEEIWPEDVTLMNRGGITLATVGVFSWARLEPREGEFDFGWLDRILDQLHEGGVRVDLATATASPPPWFSRAHPESLPVTVDGVTLWPGSRQAYCPSSPVFREYAGRLVRALAERYRDHPALELWHVSNEYGCHVAHCYCDVSAEAFRVWLRARYTTIESLNSAWGTAFWSQHYSTFDEILPPRSAPSFKNPTQVLDFDRFTSDELLACYRDEVAVLREVSPGVPITTNFMGFFKPADYWKWAAEVDVVTDDSYPDPADPESAFFAAMNRDFMRSLGNGSPWILMEQATSAVNWRPRNAVKRPGMMRARSYQCIARGADGILFFQWRQSIVGAEKFHSGLLPHGGTDTRVWREVEQLGAELKALTELGGIEGARAASRVAIVFDYPSWWAIEQEASPTTVSYLDAVFAWHRQMSRLNVAVDFVRAEDDLSAYSIVIVPSLFSATNAQLSNLDAYATSGGTLVVSYLTGITDENLHIRAGGYLGALQQTLGVWVEEFAPPAAADRGLSPELVIALVPAPPVGVSGEILGPSAGGALWSEFVRVRDAETWATFTEGALAGWPAVTSRVTAAGGSAWYVATQLDDKTLARFVSGILDAAGVEPLIVAQTEPAGWVEATRRGDQTFVINHSDADIVLGIDGTDLLTEQSARGLALPPQGVAIVR